MQKSTRENAKPRQEGEAAIKESKERKTDKLTQILSSELPSIQKKEEN